LCAAALLVHTPARASQIGAGLTGAVEGRVTDPSGAVLAGVAVRAAGDALMGERNAVSAADGSYRLDALPPGRYTIGWSLSGFQPAVRTGVPVALGQTTTVFVSLERPTARESVTVVADPRLVDRRSTALATAFDDAALAELPGSRTIGALIAATPALLLTAFDIGGGTAFSTGPFSAYGTTGYNRPTLDGIEITGFNRFRFAPDYGAFQHVSVGTGAYGPAFPSPGVHVQVVTKAGGNTYHGTLHGETQREGWQSHNIGTQGDEAATGGADSRDANRQVGYHDAAAGAGGYLSRDRAWWHASIRHYRSSSRQPAFPLAPIETTALSASARTTLRLADGHQVTAVAHASRTDQPIQLVGFLRGATAISESEASTSASRARGLVWKVEWTAAAGRSTFLAARVGAFRASRTETPRGTAPRIEDVVDPLVRGGNRDWQADLRIPQASVSLSYTRNGPLGHHLVEAGGDVHPMTAVETWNHAYPGDVLHVLQAGMPAEVYLFEAPSRAESGQAWYSLYAGDAWQVNARLTVDVGLRFDRFRLFLPAQEHPAGRFNPVLLSFPAVDNLIDWNVVAPRLAVSYDLSADATTIVKASFARYWLPPATEPGFNANPNARDWWTRYPWSDDDGSGVWEPGEQGAPQESRGGQAAATVDSALRLPFVREVTARIEHDLGTGFVLRTGIVWRGERQQGLQQRASWPFEAFSIVSTAEDPGADGVPGTGDDGAAIQVHDLPPDLLGRDDVIIGNVAGADSDYVTWDVTAERRMRGRWSAFGAFSHTWNRDHAAGYLGQRVRDNEYPLTPNDLIHTDDRGRHVFTTWSAKVYGTWDGPWGVRIAPLLRHQSGQPFGRTVVARLNYGAVRVLTEPVGARRQQHVTLLDLRVEKDLLRPAAYRLSAFVDVFNALNASPAPNVIWSSGDSFLRPLSIVPPRIARIGVRLDW
jgi:hypothetical protein